jgi:hypothetical protein
MDKDNATKKDSIVDFIEDEEYYSFKRNKAEAEKGTYAIYIFSTLALLSYVFFLMINTASFDWLDLGINILVIAVYYLLGYYSSFQPYTSFISIICLVIVVSVLEMFAYSHLNIKGLVIKAVFIVFIFMKLDAARKMQDYQAKQKK